MAGSLWVADFCNSSARADPSAAYTAVESLDDARNLCLAALSSSSTAEG